MKKGLFLFVALLLPILVYLFLKFFGRNEFDIRTYYQEGVPAPAGCGPYQSPYLVPDSTLSRLGWTGKGPAIIVLNNTPRPNLVKVQEEFNSGDYETLIAESPDYSLKTCVLLAGDTASVVLVDAERKIRGYYHPEIRDDADRLSLELKILLRKY